LRLIQLRFQVALCFATVHLGKQRAPDIAFVYQARVQSTSASFTTPLGRGSSFELRFMYKKITIYLTSEDKGF